MCLAKIITAEQNCKQLMLAGTRFLHRSRGIRLCSFYIRLFAGNAPCKENFAFPWQNFFASRSPATSVYSRSLPYAVLGPLCHLFAYAQIRGFSQASDAATLLFPAIRLVAAGTSSEKLRLSRAKLFHIPVPCCRTVRTTSACHWRHFSVFSGKFISCKPFPRQSWSLSLCRPQFVQYCGHELLFVHKWP